MNELGNLIRTARKNKRLKGKEIAERINVSTAHYSRIENGVNKPSIMALKKICQILDLSFPDMAKIAGYSKAAINKVKRGMYQELGMEQLLWKLDGLSKQDLELVMDLLNAIPNLTQKEKDTIKFIL